MTALLVGTQIASEQEPRGVVVVDPDTKEEVIVGKTDQHLITTPKNEV